MMSSPEPWRKTGRWERGATWLALGLTLAVVLVVLGLVGAAGGTFRGHTFHGLVLGLLALVATLAAGWYAWRKRRRQGGKVSMLAWLWAHVAIGALALVAAVMHAGPAALAPRSSSGWVLFAPFVVLVASGVWWRVVYARTPRAVQRSLGGPSPEASRARAERYAIEIEKLAAGRSETFQAAKALLLAHPEGDVRALSDRLAPEERQAFDAVLRLSEKRRRQLARMPAQARAAWLLQGWRWLHIPLVGFVLLLIPVHIVGALELPAQIGIASPRFESAERCADCHAGIVEEWRDSMHAHALSSPVTIVQNNVAVRDTLPPEHRGVCVNCHGPVGALLGDEVTLPFPAGAPGGYDRMAGIDCVTCHQLAPPPEAFGALGLSGMAGLAAFRDFYRPGTTYLGTVAEPVGNSFLKSAAHPVFTAPGDLCVSCHNVHLDKDGDGRIALGPDLVLQTLVDEWSELGRSRGTCVDCHMPPSAVATVDRFPWMGVDGPITRTVRSHTFVGVDYPLDAPPERTHRAAREALLGGAARMELVGVERRDGELRFGVTLTNSGSGHRLPSGFAFARQLWLEVVVSAGDQVIYTSGVLPQRAGEDDVTADLCDGETISDALAPFVEGCLSIDRDLVNLQGILLDRVAAEPGPDGEPRLTRAPGGQETPVQHPTSGPIARTRPSTGDKLGPIDPGASATYPYKVPLDAGVAGGPLTIAVRLRFRNLPPYFLRALDARRVPGDVALGPLLDNLQIIDMQTTTLTLPSP